jgi:methionyl-tRNA formyltransferase
LRLGFAGTPGFAVPALSALADSRHSVGAVFTKPDVAAGRGQTLHMSAVKKRALELGIEVHQPKSLKGSESARMLQELELDALVVVAYGLLLPPSVLAAPRLGCFNIHASLLPRWRGAAPIQRAVLAGDATTGISIMRMDAGLDTGPVVASRATDIGPLETAGSLHDRLAAIGALLMRETIDELEAGRVVEMPQSAAGATYADKIAKSEARLDWREDAGQLLRRIRAFNPAPVAETRWADTQLRIWEAMPSQTALAPGAAPGTVLGTSDEGVDVACGRGALRITRLQLAGRKPLAAAEFLRAQRLAGARFESP